MSQNLTKQQKSDFMTWVEQNEAQAFQIEGSDKYQEWVDGDIGSSLHDRWTQMWLQSGDTIPLRNAIRTAAGLPVIGTGTATDFSGAKQRLGDAYRQYLKIAQDVVTQSEQELLDLQQQFNSETDPIQKKVLSIQISVQLSTITAQQNNVGIWQKTLNDALASGEAT